MRNDFWYEYLEGGHYQEEQLAYLLNDFHFVNFLESMDRGDQEF